jgi:hypothetical protein
MAQSNQKQTRTGKQNLTKATPTKGKALPTVSLVVAAIIVICGAVFFISRQHSISQEQSRFDTVTPVLQDFQTAVRQQLGSSVTVLKETNYCETEEQDDLDNGRVWCGKMIEGAVNELPAANSLQPSTVTMNRIDSIAHTAFTTADVSISSSRPNVQGNQSSDFVDYGDTLILFGQSMYCTVYGTKPYSASDSITPPISVGNNQVYFALRCEQRSSKKFFQYYSNN